MEKNSNMKGTKSKQGDYFKDFDKALRSSGILIPVSEDEERAFKTIYHDIDDDLPEKFKNVDFMFDKNRKDAMIINLNSIVQASDTQLSYAARDGQENLPISILNKMKEIKNKSREKKSSSKK